MLFANLSYCGGYYRGYYRNCCGDYYGGSYKGCRWVRILFADLACYAGYLSAVGVRGDVSILK